MEILLLGPVEVRDLGRTLTIPAGRPRALLCLLALNAGRVLQPDRLIELLWGDNPPATAANALQVYVSRLRRAIDPDGPPFQVLASEAGGYVLRLTSEQIDLARFERLIQQGHHAVARGDIELSRRLLDEAFSLWRGTPLEGLADQPWALGEAHRLEELRLAAEEDSVEVDLVAGRLVEAITRLEHLVQRDPLRERLRGQLMLALYRSGRQADATKVYREIRNLLVEELGMEPGYDLQRIHRAILNQDAVLTSGIIERPPPRLDNLPAPTTSFVGREREMRAVATLLQQSRVVTLTGIGGIGKTRLALETARGLLGSFDQGVWLVRLASTTAPELVTEAVAEVLGIRPRGPQTLQQALRAGLGVGRWLLLLDNCEHLVEACARLVDALVRDCAGLSVLATSRESLAVSGERVFEVPPLGAVGVQLFQQRAAATAPSLQLEGAAMEQAAELCRRLEGIPLAIELAASRLDSISLHELAERIDDRFTALASSVRTVDQRHRTLRAAIDWSYELLAERERLLLQEVSAFAGGFTLAAAGYLHGREEADVLELMTGLIRKSMVQVERGGLETRYRLLDTIREYAADKLAQTARGEEVVRRHVVYFSELAERAAPNLRGPNAAVWMDRLAADQDNLRCALEATFDSRDAATLGRLLVSLWWFWYVHCFFEEGRRWLNRGLTELPPSSSSTRVSLLLGAGQLAWAQGDHDMDGLLFAQALETARSAGDEALVAQALLRLALADYASEQFGVAKGHLVESITLLRRHGPASMLAEALNNLGWLLGADEGDIEQAAPLLEEALALAREVGDQWALLEVLDSVAYVERTRGDLDRAYACQCESLSICRALGDIWSAPRVLLGMIALDLERGNAERALRLAGSSAKLQADAGMTLMPTEQIEFNRLVQKAAAPCRTALLTPPGGVGSRRASLTRSSTRSPEPDSAPIKGAARRCPHLRIRHQPEVHDDEIQAVSHSGRSRLCRCRRSARTRRGARKQRPPSCLSWL